MTWQDYNNEIQMNKLLIIPYQLVYYKNTIEGMCIFNLFIPEHPITYIRSPKYTKIHQIYLNIYTKYTQKFADFPYGKGADLKKNSNISV